MLHDIVYMIAVIVEIIVHNKGYYPVRIIQHIEMIAGLAKLTFVVLLLGSMSVN